MIINTSLITYYLLLTTYIPSTPLIAQLEVNQELSCPPPILERLKTHQIAPGETLQAIAEKYNLVPETLIRFNESLQQGILPVGTEILIPPLNGVLVEVPSGASWQDLASAYGIRADVLFEINGCQKITQIAFIPGINWQSTNSDKVDNYTGLRGYPLPSPTEIGLNYGWQTNPTNGQNIFHSGVDLLAPVGTPVMATEQGIVAFVGQEGNYGNLIVVNHGEDRQTRYAHLDSVKVTVGQQVNLGYILGTVGTTGQPDISPSHLHFEVRYKFPMGWIAQDPLLHLNF